MFSAVVRVYVIWHNPLRDDKNNRIMNIKINNKTTETFASDLRELAKELGLPECGVLWHWVDRWCSMMLGQRQA